MFKVGSELNVKGVRVWCMRTALLYHEPERGKGPAPGHLTSSSVLTLVPACEHAHVCALACVCVCVRARTYTLSIYLYINCK